MAEELVVEAVTKWVGASRILERVSFSVPAGEVFALLGPSGSGKSTVLNLIAGLAQPDEGEIRLGGRILYGKEVYVPAHKRNIGMVFQGQLLWPHLTVRQHLELVLSAQGGSAADKKERMKSGLSAVGLQHREHARPGQLSGGERQRLGIARALTGKPDVLLLDEPCSSLDTALKADFLELLERLYAEQRVTTVYVTHDAREAVRLAGRVGVLLDGRMIQCDASEAVFSTPQSPAVARLFGEGCLLEGVWSRPGWVSTVFGELEAREVGKGEAAPAKGASVSVYVRPGDLELAGEGAIKAVVKDTRPALAGWEVLVGVESSTIRLHALCRPEVGGAVCMNQKRRLIFWS